jgi:hypothetical protein
MGIPLSTAPRYAGFTHKTRPKRPSAHAADPRLAAMGRVLAAHYLRHDCAAPHGEVYRQSQRFMERPASASLAIVVPRSDV